MWFATQLIAHLSIWKMPAEINANLLHAENMMYFRIMRFARNNDSQHTTVWGGFHGNSNIWEGKWYVEQAMQHSNTFTQYTQPLVVLFVSKLRHRDGAQLFRPEVTPNYYSSLYLFKPICKMWFYTQLIAKLSIWKMPAEINANLLHAENMMYWRIMRSTRNNDSQHTTVWGSFQGNDNIWGGKWYVEQAMQHNAIRLRNTLNHWSSFFVSKLQHCDGAHGCSVLRHPFSFEIVVLAANSVEKGCNHHVWMCLSSPRTQLPFAVS